LRFGDLGFNAASRQLWVDDTEVHVSNKAFDLLAMLIERRPEAVSKADLHARLWPGTFVSPSSLPSLVSEIRDAIADSNREPKLLRTVHGFGYAFQASAAAALDPAAPPDQVPPGGWLVGTPAEIALLAGENVLGREGSGIILLRSSTVSRRHARVDIADGNVTVEDLGSKNGTYVNDRRVEGPTPVVDGDQVRFGSLVFTFRRAQPADTTQSITSQADLRRRS
jgi:DNA-binding winged helix-turn-helix (wHTH) protein